MIGGLRPFIALVLERKNFKKFLSIGQKISITYGNKCRKLGK